MKKISSILLCLMMSAQFAIFADEIVEVPAVEVPAVEVPAVEVPAVEVPAVEVPAVEVPAVEVPAVEVPAVEVPAVEVPAVEVPAEITTEEITQVIEEVEQALEEVVTTEPEISIEVLSPTEIEKWQYIQNYFAAELKNDPRLSAKVGKFVNDHMISFVIPEVFISSLLSIGALMIGDEELFNHYLDNHDKTELLAIFGLSMVSSSVAYGLTQLVADKLEGKETFYTTSLTNFVKDWNNQKDQTPTALHPLFDNLQQDYAGNNGKLSQSSIKNAQKVVDTIIATALIVQAAV